MRHDRQWFGLNTATGAIKCVDILLHHSDSTEDVAFASLRSRDVAQIVKYNEAIIFYRLHTWNIMILAARSKAMPRLQLVLYKPDKVTRN